jgi:hypothetical protein
MSSRETLLSNLILSILLIPSKISDRITGFNRMFYEFKGDAFIKSNPVHPVNPVKKKLNLEANGTQRTNREDNRLCLQSVQ